jgi:cytoplasmic iron level regulating protein YaaA (DUF328/UPF0246 family)
MIIVISPAKTLDFESELTTKRHTKPRFLADSQELIDTMRRYSALDIAELMKVSMKIAELNFERFAEWHTPFTTSNSRQAVLAFKGDVYDGLEASTLSKEDFDFLQDHLRILSGLYGLLRPLDLMQPYRLEMGRNIPNPRGKNLYEFWGHKITDTLNRELAADDGTLINLASVEYFKAVKPREIQGRIITPQFKDWKNGQYKMISFYAKKARGMMTRYITTNRLTNPEDIQGFDTAGYRFSEEMSKGDDWVFLRRT